VAAVAGVSFSLDPASTLGIVGSSGSGKSTLVRLLLALETPDRGSVRFAVSLDPCLRIETIVSEPLVAHDIGSPADRRARVAELLSMVGLEADTANRRPRVFSGGERQRIAIARALSTNPELLILDEPVSSLDATVQAQILDLILELRRQHDLALVFISHDLSAVSDTCQQTAVMHEGKFVEIGPTPEVLENPRHPHTRALIESTPRPGAHSEPR
jgi:peptide/nickel transport system ATP-binding protein